LNFFSSTINSQKVGDKKVLIMWGGWEGHKPQLFVKYVSEWLEKMDYEYVVSKKLEDYTNFKYLSQFDLIIQSVTMSELSKNIDLIILRESTEGLFYTAAVHNRCPVENDQEVQDVMKITRATTEKLHDFAFKLARQRKKKGKLGKVTCVDKANVFRSQAFFRKIFDERKVKFKDIDADYCYVDAMALNLIRNPWEYDVMVMENMFGDILSDLGGGLIGGMGMASCAEIGDNHGLFQPAHGSAPDILGQDKANPLATILSASLMLEYLSDKTKCKSTLLGSRLIETAIEIGFERNELRPIEFGGDMGTTAITETLSGLLKDNEIQKQILT